MSPRASERHGSAPPGSGQVGKRNVRLECGHTTTRPPLVSFPNGRGMHECVECGRLVRERAR